MSINVPEVTAPHREVAAAIHESIEGDVPVTTEETARRVAAMTQFEAEIPLLEIKGAIRRGIKEQISGPTSTVHRDDCDGNVSEQTPHNPV